MLYKDIFSRTSDGDRILLRQYPSNVNFDDVELYQKFTKDKLALKKGLEKKYKGDLTGGSFRVFLEYATRSVEENKPIRHQLYRENNDYVNGKILEMPWFKENEEEIVKDVIAQYKELLDRYPNIKEVLFKAFWDKDKTFKPLGLEKYCFGIGFNDIYRLKNGFDSVEICFQLNDEVKKIFIDEVVDDWGSNIGYYQDACIFKGKKAIFTSTTHEGWYSFSEEKDNV